MSNILVSVNNTKKYWYVNHHTEHRIIPRLFTIFIFVDFKQLTTYLQINTEKCVYKVILIPPIAFRSFETPLNFSFKYTVWK